MASSFITKTERGRVVSDVQTSCAKHPSALACFVAFWVWMDRIMGGGSSGPGFLIFPEARAGAAVLPAGLAPADLIFVFMFLCFAGSAAWHIRTRGELCQPKHLKVASACMVAGVALSWIWAETGGSSTSLCFCSAAALAFGTTLLNIQMMSLVGLMGMRRTLSLCAVSFFLAVAPSALVDLLAPLPFHVVMLSLPPIMCLNFTRELRESYPEGLPVAKREERLLIPWRFIITCFVQGIGVGLPVVMLQGAPGLAAAIGGSLLTVVVIAALALSVRLDFNMLIYQAGFFLMGLGFLLIACQGLPRELGAICQGGSFSIIDIAFWTLSAHLIKDAGLSATWIAVGPSSALMLGQALAAVPYPHLVDGLSDEGRQLLLCAVAFGVLASALFLSNGRNLKTGWGTVEPIAEDGRSALLAACAYLCREYGLTQREGEVLAQLASGESRKGAARKLFLSEETVKTHTRGIYRKLDVHSKDELSEVLSSTYSTFALGDASKS